jgi:hypothetical protein
MIYLARSKQRRDYIADRIRENMDSPREQDGSAASSDDHPETQSLWQRFTYQLPAWALLLAFAAVPATAILRMFNR